MYLNVLTKKMRGCAYKGGERREEKQRGGKKDKWRERRGEMDTVEKKETERMSKGQI